ncbi:MAG: replication-associated recombination protein A [Bacteroidetes bacterium]|nr:replication-associated recombination protein A [Bacteroidota bacterium]
MNPLAERMRPVSLDDYIGQEQLIGKGSALRRAIEAGNIPSMILWGPPGVGKTTLASIISRKLRRPFYTLSAVSSGVKDVRDVIERAQQYAGELKEVPGNPILFIDEIHRFSKSQQDSLLGAVEKGIVTLIGATTENPSFEVISALLSRCQVYVLKELSKDDLEKILKHALSNDPDLKRKKIIIQETEALMRLSGGDARKLLNLLDLVTATSETENEIIITDELVLHVAQEKIALYDKGGEQHYDIISAFIKSMRGSDPNAAVYWLARMIKGGEDPLFIARRMVILASEDIGIANPTALVIANACFDAVNKIGYPEGRIILAQAAVYLATSPKSNASYIAIEEAMANIEKTGDLPVPLHIRNAPTKLMKELGYGKDYKYAHQYEDNFINLEYLPETISGTKFYDPGNNVRENETRDFLKRRWKEKYGY